jgi:uncharacterized protein YoxC
MANPQEELKQQEAIVNEIKQQLQLYNELMTKKKEISQWDARAKSDLNEQINQWKQLNRSVDRVKKDLAAAEGELKGLSKEAEKAAKALDSQAKAVDDLSDNFSDLNAFQRSITRQYGEQSDETKRINKNVDAIKAATGGVGKFLKKNVNLEEDQRDALIEASDYLKNMPSSFDKLNKQVSRGTINQKKYNQYVAELSDNWEEILDKINDSGKGLGGMKKALREMGKAQGLSGEASQRYEQLLKFEENQKANSVVTGAALSGLPGGEGLNQLLEARVKEQTGNKSGAKLSRTLAGAAIGAGVTSFALAMREYIPGLSKAYYILANKYAPQLAARQEDVNIAQAKFNRDAKLFGGPLSKKYGKGMYYAAEAAKEFDFKMQSLNVEFSKAAKTAFFGRGIGSVGYNASQMQLAGVGAESVASAMTDIASGANVNFFGSKEGLGAQAAVFSKQMGISTQSIGDIMAAFRRIDGSSGKTALNMVYTSAKMADIAKLNPAVILQDMAEASGKMLSYNIQNAKSFQQQAIALRQMGGNLPKFAEGITGSILNYKQSLQAQISLSNMLNRPVDFSVAQSLAYQGKYGEAFANIKQSGVLESVRKAGPLAAAQFQQIFGMGIDEFQARAEGGKSMGLAGTMDAENKAFLKRVSGAEKASMIAEAKITVTKAVVDAEFAKALAVGLNENPAYRNAVTSLDALSVASSRLQSIMEAIVTGLGAAAGGLLLNKMAGKAVTATAAGGAKSATAGTGAGIGGNFAGYKITGTGANQLVRNAKGQIVSAAEAKAFKDASKLAKYSKFANVAGKGLGVLGVGLDVYGRVSEGQTMTQTAAGVGTSMAGAYGGAQLGASIGALGGPLAPFTVPLGGLIGGIGGYFAGGKVSDMVTGVGKPKQQEQVKQQQQVQTALDEGTQMLTVMKNIELLVAEMAGYQATPAVVQMIMDGKDISNSLVKHQLNSRGQKKETTLKQSLGWYR